MKEKEEQSNIEEILEEDRLTTIVKLGIKQSTGVGINISSTNQEFRIYKQFYNLTVMDIVNFKHQNMSTSYIGFNNGTKWLEKKMNQLCSIKYFDAISINVDNDKAFTFNPYQYGFDFKEKYDKIRLLDSYDHLNNLKQLNKDLSKVRTLIKTMSCKELLELATTHKQKTEFGQHTMLNIDYNKLIRQQ